MTFGHQQSFVVGRMEAPKKFTGNLASLNLRLRTNLMQKKVSNGQHHHKHSRGQQNNYPTGITTEDWTLQEI